MADENNLLSTEHAVAEYGDGESFVNFFDRPQYRVEAHIPRCSDGSPGHSWPSFPDSGSLERALIDMEKYKREYPTADRWGIAKIEYQTRTTLVHLDAPEEADHG